ncbi:MAG: T9SS type A sorting domain-containing protein [Flavobacteriales bacterium]
MKQKIIPIIFLFVFFSLHSVGQVVCDLTYLTTIENFDVYKHNPSGAILYRAKMAIDADGCPRAYGPNNSGLDWTANAGYPGNWWGIVTDVNGDPVIQGPGDPYPGMYVSSTSLVQTGYSNSNPLRYVDSENIPYIALPSALQSLANIAKGDLAYVRNTTNGNTCFAYFADTGPGGKLGEGSMALAVALGINSSPKTGGTSQPILDYVVFPQSGLGQGNHLSVAQINSMGQAELTAAGGLTLPDCLNAQAPSLDCSNTVVLSCGVSYHGNSSAASSNVSTFGCNTWTETGPERVHSITPSVNGTITATISNYTGDLDVYILASCDAMDCLGTVSSSSATYSGAIAANTYYVVVDADDGSGSAYDIVVNCSAITGIEEDYSANSIKIYPNPTTGIIHIDSRYKNINKAMVLNELGMIIETITVNKNEPISIEQYPRGIYFLNLIDSDLNSYFLKVVKN